MHHCEIVAILSCKHCLDFPVHLLWHVVLDSCHISEKSAGSDKMPVAIAIFGKSAVRSMSEGSKGDPLLTVSQLKVKRSLINFYFIVIVACYADRWSLARRSYHDRQMAQPIISSKGDEKVRTCMGASTTGTELSRSKWCALWMALFLQ